jgi:hypothetical protein
MRAAAEQGGEAARERGVSDEECDERSRRALRLNLGQYLHKGYHGPWWTAKERALLGKLPDDEVAARVGRTREAVRSRRRDLGIPNPQSNRWSEEEDRLVRSLPAREAATRTGRSLRAVYDRRRELGLPGGRATNGRRRSGRAAP